MSPGKPNIPEPAAAPEMRLTGTHFGVFAAETRDGSVRLSPPSFERHPTALMRSLEDVLTSPLRIRAPSVRKGFLARGKASKAGRGDEDFVQVSWPEALDIVAGALREIYDAHGPAAVYGGSYGWASAGRFHHAQSQIHRFLNTLGGYTASVNTYSHAAAEVLLPHVIGSEDDIIYSGTTWPVIRDNTRAIIAFGGLPFHTHQVNPGGVSEHVLEDWLNAVAKAGVKVLSIGPIRSRADDILGSRWITPRPNSDTAFMLGMAHHLLSEGLHDRNFLARYTVGFDRFEAYLTGSSDGIAKTPAWAADICAVPASEIRAAADMAASQRSLISATWSLQRADHGEQSFWMVVALASMLGQIGLPGGGFAFGLTSFNGVANPVTRRRFAALPQGHNPVRTRIPVARITELLENPGGRIDFDGETITFPDIKGIYWAGGNPFHHHQHLARLRAAWKKPDVVICNDIEWNATARHADIVFPVSSVLERDDIMAPNSDRRLVAMRKVADAVGQSRTDYEIFCGLAERLGTLASFSEGRSEAEWLRHLYEKSIVPYQKSGTILPPFEDFWREGSFVHCPAETERVALADFRQSPETHRLPTRSGKIEIHCETIAAFGYADCPGHPTWLPPREWLGAITAAPDALHLLSPQPRNRLHGQLDGNGPSAAAKIEGREPAYLNPAEARRRGIEAGSIIRIFNDRGEIFCGAVPSANVAPGVIVVETGAWYAPLAGHPATCCHGNPNTLTADRGTSRLAQGPSCNSVLVHVESAGNPPPNSIHQAPVIGAAEPGGGGT